MKYFLLQIKKLIRALPIILIVALLLLSIVLTVLSQFSAYLKSEQEAKFKIAVVGNTNSRFFNFGMVALKTFDSSRFSIDIELTNEEAAKSQLLSGEISAYIVIPKNFIKNARKGKTVPVTYYTTASTIDISGLMRNEITNVISVLLKESQKGIFGEEQLLIENGYEELSDIKTDELSIKYIDFIVDRNKMYKTEITGVSYGVDLLHYLIIGQCVIFLCMLTIPFSVLLIRRDNGLVRLLSASGRGPLYSASLEYAAMLLSYILSLLILFFAVFVGSHFIDLNIISSTYIDFGSIWVYLLPIVAMICAFSFAIEEMSGNILSYVTGFFFISMGLCYISGCMYPLYALPPVLRKIAMFTPTGVAGRYISFCVTGDNTGRELAVIIIYTLLFIVIAALTRKHKAARGDGA